MALSIIYPVQTELCCICLERINGYRFMSSHDPTLGSPTFSQSTVTQICV